LRDPISIRAADLVFGYPKARKEGSRRPFRLDCPRWEVPRGARVALSGPSGSGKSTLLNLIGGLLRPERGTLEVEGRRLDSLGEAERRAHRIRTMGFVFQDFPLVGYLDVEENVLLPYRLNRALRLNPSVRRRSRELLDSLGIGEMRRSRPAELSQGEQQRVAIARALITEPSLLLADEPTAGLDQERSESVLDLLEGLTDDRHLTLVMVSHDPAVLSRFDTVVDLRELSRGAGDDR
jgi:ABC-type lipoprotein export system ATPase subunit